MLKQFLIFLLLSLVIVLFSHYFYQLILFIDYLYVYVDTKLIPVFNQTGLGLTIRKTIVLCLLPIAIASVPALVYRAVKGGTMPYYIPMAWMLWTIIVLSTVLAH